MQTQNVTFPKCFEFMNKELSNTARNRDDIFLIKRLTS